MECGAEVTHGSLSQKLLQLDLVSIPSSGYAAQRELTVHIVNQLGGPCVARCRSGTDEF